MITASKSDLKAHMLEYFRKVEENGEDLIVTSHRKPVLKVSRLAPCKSVVAVFGDVWGKAVLPEAAVVAQETREWGDLT